MEYRQLGRTDLKVSTLCLGSMTWGSQNSEADGHAQIDMSLDHGVNFIDTAEMYPSPPLSQETQGSTEEIIGSWFAKTGRRQDVILATKIVGAGNGNVRGRDGADISPATIREAVDNSLKRLQTDYIDLYQFHWPNRGSYHFRKYWDFDPSGQNRDTTRAHITECLHTLADLVAEGKIRHFGTSNESCWGASQYLEIAEAEGLPRMASIQNEYSLLCRKYDLDLAELSINEDVGLLAFSPLAAGVLSGKYQGDVTPKGSRRELNENLGGRLTEMVYPAVDAYLAVAKKHDLDVCQMSLAWCAGRPFMGSVIFGATNLDQLENTLKSGDLTLSDEVITDIQAVYRRYPSPL
ncbi:MAG: aldo/keto reductase [Alphaproteobacteria bacterium]